MTTILFHMRLVEVYVEICIITMMTQVMLVCNSHERMDPRKYDVCYLERDWLLEICPVNSIPT